METETGYRIQRSVALFWIVITVLVRCTYSQLCDARNYTLIQEPRRSTMVIFNSSVDKPLCDDWINEGIWYRFNSNTGQSIVERAPNDFVPMSRCGTQAPIYIRGLNSHPLTDNTMATAAVCAHYSGNTCAWNATIQIYRCPALAGEASYFLYRLKAAPGCSLSYCVGEQPGCALGDYWNGVSCINDPCYNTTASSVSLPGDPCRPTTDVPTTTLKPTIGVTTTTTLSPSDPCFSNPCRNGATCSSQSENGYLCICFPGYTNTRCDVEINDCESSPCYPFGKCTDLLNDYSCTCNTGYIPVNDRNCTAIDYCTNYQTTPCQNGGTCANQNELGRYYCVCPPSQNPGELIVGLYCETRVTTLPTPSGITPSTGIVAGGTNVTITGRGMALFPPLGAYFINNDGTTQSLYAPVIPELTRDESIVIRTPPAKLEYVGTEFMVTVQYTGPRNFTNENLRFTYTGNPVVSAIEPVDVLAAGNVRLTVLGQNMDTVQNPMMDITTFVYNQTAAAITDTNHTRENCSLLNATAMICLVPLGIVPPAFAIEVSTRVKRGVIDLAQPLRYSLNSGDRMEGRRSRRRKRAPVATLSNDDGSTFELFLGFLFDDLPTYRNISKSVPSISLTLVPAKMEIMCKTLGTVEFMYSENIIRIPGMELSYGCSAEDYQVTVSDRSCDIVRLTDKELACRPPKYEPKRNAISALQCGTGEHAVLITVSNRVWVCCLKYPHDNVPLIVGVTFAVIIVVMLIVLAVVLVVKRSNRLIQPQTTKPDVSIPNVQQVPNVGLRTDTQSVTQLNPTYMGDCDGYLPRDNGLHGAAGAQDTALRVQPYPFDHINS